MFEVHRGEVVGLVGDNGAGKSTLVKVMNGFYSPNSGRMHFKGNPVTFRSPREARGVGIETVYQDLALIPALSMWRNFFLGRELKSAVVHSDFSRKARCERSRCVTFAKWADSPPVSGRTGRHSVGWRASGPGDRASPLFRRNSAITRRADFGAIVKKPRRSPKGESRATAAWASSLSITTSDTYIRICDRIVIMEGGRVIRSVRRDD